MEAQRRWVIGPRSHSLLRIVSSSEPRSDPVLTSIPWGWHPGGSCLRLQRGLCHTFKSLVQERISPDFGDNSSSLCVKIWGGFCLGGFHTYTYCSLGSRACAQAWGRLDLLPLLWPGCVGTVTTEAVPVGSFCLSCLQLHFYFTLS